MPPYPVNVLTQAGFDELKTYVEQEGMGDFIPRPITRKLPFQSLDHEFYVRDVAVQFERSVVEQGWDFTYWLGDEDFEMWKGHFTGQMIPDGFFLIDVGTKRFPHFLEIDMGTETVVSGLKGGAVTIKDWKTKMERYLDYLSRFGSDTIFEGLVDPVVLIVAPSIPRMKSLKDAARAAGCKGMFWFTTRDLLAEDWPMAALNYIWSTPNEKVTRSLVNRVRS